MPRSEKWPDLDDAAAAIVEKYLAAPPKRQAKPLEYEGRRRTSPITEGVKSVAPDSEPIDPTPTKFGRNAQTCRFPDAPCDAFAWKGGVCRRHYNLIVKRRQQAKKKERRL